ncbi:unnamed protein product [Rodentolepis nana]|uniref:E3 ubiquitin-protein ligase RNF170 n=1 Tax=Rodentolepis nana TaxID=102285 RepID=A0A0R3TSB1_RODNA|nr:unnamed protein product [Rodentolepis nana]
MEIISGLENSVSAVFVLSSVFIVLFVRAIVKRFTSSSSTYIHPESQQTVDEVRQTIISRSLASYTHVDTSPSNGEIDICPICLENLKFCVETNCRHRFCGDCFYAYWQQMSPLSNPICPVCRGQLRFVLKRFTIPEMQSDMSLSRSQIESNVDLFNRRYSGNPVSFIDQLRDLPVLLRYFWRVIFDGEGNISCLLRLRLIVLFLFVFFYVISPLDIFPESIVGVFGLLDDCLVCLVFCIYLGALFRGRLVADV